ncbi:MAG TPA: hypothetical protein VKA53_01040 [Thermoanaerobaculia bacterium]|nr:hypothetical protein [Thermoanaerobaculia bacterium]
MKTALWILAAAVALFLIDRLALWAESRGWIFYRRRHPSPGTVGNAFLNLQSMIEPGKVHVIEAQEDAEPEQEPSGDPPEGGAQRP